MRRAVNVQAVQRALEAAGIEFIPENGGGAGVRLRKGRCEPRLPHHITAGEIRTRLGDRRQLARAGIDRRVATHRVTYRARLKDWV